ncbi:unnamed protein product, partial [marine sediment metagenome]
TSIGGHLFKGQFYTITPKLNINIIENRILRETLRYLLGFNLDEDYVTKINSLLHHFRNVDDLNNISQRTFDLISIHSLNEHYKEALTYSRLLLLGLGLKMEHGEVPTYSFWLGMDYLFEEFVNMMVQEAVPNYIVRYQPEYYFYSQPEGQPRIMIKPDSVIVDDGPSFIFDAKWKTDTTRSDLFQILAYAHALNSDSVLVTPTDGPFQSICYEIGGTKIYKVSINTSWNSIEDFNGAKSDFANWVNSVILRE